MCRKILQEGVHVAPSFDDHGFQVLVRRFAVDRLGRQHGADQCHPGLFLDPARGNEIGLLVLVTGGEQAFQFAQQRTSQVELRRFCCR